MSATGKLPSSKEQERLTMLASYHILDTAEETDFDDLTTLAAAICGTPIALISLVDKERQWFKSHKGINATETPIEQSFCAHAIISTGDIMIIEDAHVDDRFKDNPLVTGDPNITFYAGVPLTNEDGYSLGTLCVIDPNKKVLGIEQQAALKILARQVMDKLELRKKMQELKDSEKQQAIMNEELKAMNEELLQTRDTLFTINLKLEESEANLSTLANNISQLTWMADEQGDIYWYNQRWFDYSGTTLDEMKGSGWQKVQHPDHVNRVVEKYNKDIVTDGEIWEDTFPLRGKDGSYRWFLSRAVPLKDAEGKIIRWFGTNTDITEQRELSMQKDEFLGVASHELKTPITSLKANLQLLDKLKETPGHPMLPRLIDASARSVEKINGLVDDLLNMSRFGEGQLKLEKSTFTISEMLNLCCNHVRIAGTHELVIQGDESLQVYADEHRIDQVVVNLVNNAVKYAPASKKIYFIVGTEGKYARIAVKDFGPGIPEEQQPHLFDRYWRASHAGAKYTGLGLGLYICAEIVKRHGGEIGVDSKIGEGSTFWFTIPLG